MLNKRRNEFTMIHQIFWGEALPYFSDAVTIRETVFVEEQGYAKEVELDGKDATCFHIVVYNESGAIGTARMFTSAEASTYIIGRVAVLKAHRQEKVGAYIMQQLLAHAKQLGLYPQVLVHAQVQVQQFYAYLGFEVTGPEYLEEGQPHISMVYPIRSRGIEVAKGFEDKDVEIPVRKTAQSAGYDLACIADVTLHPLTTTLVPTGLKAYMEADEVLELHIRSSVAIKQNVWCANNVGIVDADYYNNADNDGHIMVPLYNANTEPIHFAKGERIAQAIFKKYLTVDAEEGDFAIRSGGFGSTGK